MWQTVKGVILKLSIFRQDLATPMDHFSTLKAFIGEREQPNAAQPGCGKGENFISEIDKDFSERFPTCKKIDKLLDLITVPTAMDKVKWKAQLAEFITNVKVADVELELCNFLEDKRRMDAFETAETSAF